MGIYCPPSAPVMALEELGKVLSTFASKELIILGDFNLDWLSDISGSLKELCLELNLSQLMHFVTRPNTSHLNTLILEFSHRALAITACVGIVKGLKSKACSIFQFNFKNVDEQAFFA